MASPISPGVRSAIDLESKFKTTTRSFEQHGWKIETSKGAISSAKEIDDAQAWLGIPIPEMIFGNNKVTVSHAESGFSIDFSTFKALDLVDKTGAKGLVQVAHSKAWLKTRQEKGVTERSAAGDKVEGIIKPFDWTYTTDYKGDLSKELRAANDDEGHIPLDKLQRPDQILFFDELTLYEDELGDNGIVWLNVKVRVMAERMLLLARFFLRVDNVMFRVRDTRVFVEFGTGEVIREYTEKEEEYDYVKRRVPMTSKDHGPYLRDANWVSQQMKVKSGLAEVFNV